MYRAPNQQIQRLGLLESTHGRQLDEHVFRPAGCDELKVRPHPPIPGQPSRLRRLAAWILPLLTTLVTVAFFVLMSVRSPLLTHAIGPSYIATGVAAGVAAIALNVLAIAIYGFLASRSDRPP